ncbi:hypothetical protein HYH03_013799 [Edaphochlamys debaryana]|uniref:Uncharacterized protein n=1 Tax=Edaphochlamys debaryana TaxID=47281 RepID=A0A836BU75_9CHLO|nr:hypothetical protein HYH03_013799 [Edaphochlamys debaryana]|eukprot:KAG2487663.1 hypothetical protein HYH03_013799 [Edaphochlamys debaryana]
MLAACYSHPDFVFLEFEDHLGDNMASLSYTYISNYLYNYSSLAQACFANCTCRGFNTWGPCYSHPDFVFLEFEDHLGDNMASLSYTYISNYLYNYSSLAQACFANCTCRGFNTWGPAVPDPPLSQAALPPAAITATATLSSAAVALSAQPFSRAAERTATATPAAPTAGSPTSAASQPSSAAAAGRASTSRHAATAAANGASAAATGNTPAAAPANAAATSPGNAATPARHVRPQAR